MIIRNVVSVVIIAAMFTVAAPVQAQSPSSADEVKNWTLKKWSQTKAEFAKEKAKWADCRRQNEDKKLKGRASWSFLYDCMKA